MENGSLTWPAASGGARPAMAPRQLLLLRSRAEKERERGGDRVGRLGARGGVPTGLCRSTGRPRPRRRRTAATWPAPGGARWARPRAGEEVVLGRAAERVEREAVRPSSDALFSFF